MMGQATVPKYCERMRLFTTGAAGAPTTHLLIPGFAYDLRQWRQDICFQKVKEVVITIEATNGHPAQGTQYRPFFAMICKISFIVLKVHQSLCGSSEPMETERIAAVK